MTILLLVAAAMAAFAAATLAAIDGAFLAAYHTRPISDGGASVDSAGHEKMLDAILFGRALAQLTTGAALTAAIGAPEFDASGSWVFIVMLAVALALGIDGAARSWGYRDAGKSPVLNRTARFVDALFAPLAAPIEAADRWLVSVLPSPVTPDSDDRELTAEQFREVIAAEAEVTRAEAAILQGVFALDDTDVHEVMVPRVDIVGVDSETPWSEVLDRVRSLEHSRFPVFHETIDEVLGVLHVKDLVPYILADQPPAPGWGSLIRPTAFIPRTRLIGDQLRDFRATGSHIAIVVDEYGGTAGMVTIEDLLEELVGEIHDEHDEEELEVEALDERRFWVPGRMTIDELGDIVGHDFEVEDITTVGGLVYSELGRVPLAGEAFTLGGFRVVVERVRRRRVERVYFERLSPVRGGRS